MRYERCNDNSDAFSICGSDLFLPLPRLILILIIFSIYLLKILIAGQAGLTI